MTVNVDTYVLPEESNAFLSEVLPASDPLRITWEVLTDEEKAGYLTAALRRLENLNFSGRKASFFQPLKFPRISRELPANYENAPLEVKRAQVVWATEIVKEELYGKRRNAEACAALGVILSPQTERPAVPVKVGELLHRWITVWRRV